MPEDNGSLSAEASEEAFDRLTALLERAERDRGDLLHAVSCYLNPRNWHNNLPLPVLTFLMESTYKRVTDKNVKPPAPAQETTARVDGPGGGRMTRKGFHTGD